MLRYFTIALTSLLIMVGCKIVDEKSGGDSKSAISYRITASEIQGWTELVEAGWTTYTKANMHSLVNGDAKYYTDIGMVEGAEQQLVNESEEKLTVWMMDFASVATAAQMFSKLKVDKVTTPIVISGFTESVAIANKSGEGCAAYAVFGQYVLRLSFENYNDADLSLIDASLFLKVYQKR